jgi:pentose-5-phosphate-3-epimerase
VVVSKLSRLSSACDIKGLFVQCDGGVTFNSIPRLLSAGINNFVCGSSTLYNGCDFRKPEAEVFAKIRANKARLDELLKNEL